jgi:uncharacterized protein
MIPKIATILRCVLFFCGAFFAAGAPPPVPPNGRMVSDFAGVLDAGSIARIEGIQQVALGQHGTPIVVVTIRTMADYGGGGRDIKEFARDWFDRWQIGTLGSARNPGNRGILLLVSTLDRKARIELGADWGNSWDLACQRIMDGKIVPRFKKSEYSGGIADGVAELSRIAASGPRSTAPGATLLEKAAGAMDSNDTVRDLRSANPYSPNASTIMIAGGILLLVAGIFIPAHRKPLLITGIVLLIAGISLTAIIAIVVTLFGKKGRSSSAGSGGGFSGGFSGGGGASGSW